MGATEEQMALLESKNVTHVSYVLLLYSVAFLLFLFVCVLLNLYANHAWPLDPKTKQPIDPASAEGGLALNGSAHGKLVRSADRQRVADAEEFELTGLISEDEAEDKDAGEGSSQGSSTSERLRRKEAAFA